MAKAMSFPQNIILFLLLASYDKGIYSHPTQIASSACARSAIRSAASSMPQE